MATWDKKSVEDVIKEKGWYVSDREIDYGHQFTLTDGTKINCYNTGTVQVQGKNTEVKGEALSIFNKQPTSSKQNPRTETMSHVVSTDSPNRVFIVYGHDFAARDQLELLLRRLRLETTVLQNIAGGGDTIIEKLEQLTDADFACVLLTPDDEGRKRIEGQNEAYRPRARQNVVLELGMVLARLGRSKVAILVKGDGIEKPSDIEGLIYIPFSDSVDDAKNSLAANLQKAGFDIQIEDLNK